jgi:ACS family hexuronate transporter-like MFS transporter
LAIGNRQLEMSSLPATPAGDSLRAMPAEPNRPLEAPPSEKPDGTALSPAVAPESAAPGAMTHFRWVMLGLLFFAIAINCIDRVVMAILGPFLREMYHISGTQYGNIQAAFAMAYAIGQVPCGAWLDRVGTRIGCAVSLAAWSAVSAAHAVARTALGFGFMRALLGVSEAPAFPAAVKTIAEWFPKKERALAMGVVNAGTAVGAVFAPWIVPIVARQFGWQWAFISTGLIGGIWLAFWIPLYRRPHEHRSVSPKELAYINSDPPEPTARLRWVTLLSYRPAQAFALSKFLTDSIWWFYMAWLPDFFHSRFGLNLRTIGLPLMVIYGMAGVGSVFGGGLSSVLLRRGCSLNFARKTALLVSALCVVPIVFAAHSNLWMSVVLLGLAMAAHQGFSSNQYTLVSDAFPKRAVGSVAGMGGTFGYIGASLFASATGYILAVTQGKYFVLFIIAGSAYVLAFTIIHLLVPRIGPVALGEGQSAERGGAASERR